MSDSSILVIGSINIDHTIYTENIPLPGQTVSGTDYRIGGGGKGANQALACASLGGNVVMIGAIGSNDHGRVLVEGLKAKGINCDRVRSDRDDQTGVALISVSSKGENSIVVYPGANGSISAAEIERNADAIEAADFLLMQLEIPTDAVAAALRLAGRSNVRTVLNPAPAKTLSSHVLRDVDFITPNQTEAQTITGIHIRDRRSAAEAASWMHDKGVQTVLITLGADGVFVSAGGDSEIVPAADVTAVDTTAAGDVFNGAFVAALSKDIPVTEAARYASSCAAVSVTRRGAQESIPTAAEVSAFQRQNVNQERAS